MRTHSAIVVLPSTFRYFKKEKTISLVDEFLENGLNGLKRYSVNENKQNIVQCLCKEIKIKAETYDFFKDQIRKINQEWNSLSYYKKEETTVYRINQKITNMVKAYYELMQNSTTFQKDCSVCNGSGSAKSYANPEGKFIYIKRDLNYNARYKQNPKYPLNFFKVKDIDKSASNLILPDQTWIIRPSFIFDLSFHDFTPKEWDEQVFFKSLKPYHSNFAVLVTFYL